MGRHFSGFRRKIPGGEICVFVNSGETPKKKCSRDFSKMKIIKIYKNIKIIKYKKIYKIKKYYKKIYNFIKNLYNYKKIYNFL